MLSHFIAHWRGVRIAKGARLRLRADVRTTGLVYFNGPFSSGFHCEIPQGAELVVYSASGLAFQCTLADPALEERLIPKDLRLDPKYAGTAFTFGLGDLGSRLEVLARE